jgi:hypothetical protein
MGFMFELENIPQILQDKKTIISAYLFSQKKKWIFLLKLDFFQFLKSGENTLEKRDVFFLKCAIIKCMISSLYIFLLPVTLFIFIHCSPSDLRSTKIKLKVNSGSEKSLVISNLNSLLEKGLRPQDKKEKFKFKAVFKDTWSSSLLRRFTILTTNSQKMQIEVEKNGDVKLEILDGTNSIQNYRVKDHLVYYEKDEKPTKDDRAKIYIESLVTYISLPMLISEFSILLDESNEDFYSVFATNESPEPDPKRDQYVYRFDKKKKELDHILFTYRDVFQSYQGVLQYSNYLESGSQKYPSKIQIKDTLKDATSVHEIQILEFFIEN